MNKIWTKPETAAIALPLCGEVMALNVMGKSVDFLCDSGRVNSSLPVEFFAHQLLECDTESRESVIELCRVWGIPLHPIRYNANAYGVQSAIANEWKQAEKAISETNAHRYQAETESGKYALASINECALAIRHMQESVLALHESVLAGNLEQWNGGIVNAGVMFPYRLGNTDFAGYCRQEQTSLTNAICNQIAETYASEEPWTVCACEGCGMPFKAYQATAKRQGRCNRKPSGKTAYCCKRHENTQSARNRRKENRIAH